MEINDIARACVHVVLLLLLLSMVVVVVVVVVVCVCVWGGVYACVHARDLVHASFNTHIINPDYLRS